MNDVARQIYSGTPGAQAISDTLWSIPRNSTFPTTLSFAGKLFNASICPLTFSAMYIYEPGPQMFTWGAALTFS